jgi:ethanolamine kinase
VVTSLEPCIEKQPLEFGSCRRASSAAFNCETGPNWTIVGEKIHFSGEDRLLIKELLSASHLSTNFVAMAATTTSRRHSGSKIRCIPLSYNNAESQTSALRLILALMPQWQHTDGKIEFIRFTDGITNTLLKAINKRPGLSEEEIDNEAVLLRAYGKGTDLIIDRDRETQNHELLMQYSLAPMLLARFHNGMLYRFMRGAVTSPEDLRRESIYRGVARRLAQWHAVVPCLPSPREPLQQQLNGSAEIGIPAPRSSHKDPALQTAMDNVAPRKPVPNVWSVMQKWIYALPSATEVQRTRQANLQKELIRLIEELSGRPGLGENSVGSSLPLTSSC